MSSATDDYVSPQYEPVEVVKIWSKNPRFGHPDDPSILLDGSAGISDYVQGTIFAGALCLGIFVVWFLLLAIFKCLGKRVGFLSGRQFTTYNSSSKPMMVRVTVIFSFLIVLTMCVLWPLLGNQKVLNAFDSVKDSVNEIENLSLQVIDLADSLILIGDQTIPIRDALDTQIGVGICQQSGSFPAVDDAATALQAALGALGDFSQGPLTDMKESFEGSFVDQVDKVQDNLKLVERYAGWTKYISIPYAFFSFIFAVGAMISMRGSNAKAFFCLQTWFALPLWMLLLFCSSILCTIFGIIAVINSDICYANGSPDATLLKVVARSNISSSVQEAVEFYIDGCKTANPFDDVDSYLGQLEDARAEIANLLSEVAKNPDIENICGSTFTSFIASTNDADGVFEDLISKVTEAVTLSSCGSINPIYIGASHDALCTDIPNAVVTIFALIIVVSIFGMIMLTCRAGSYPNIETSSEDNYPYVPSKETGENEIGQAQAY